MKRTLFQAAAALLAAVLLLGCGAEPAPTAPTIDDSVLSALDSAPDTVTLLCDGRSITIENAAAMTVDEMLGMADITLLEGDLLTLAPEQALSGNVVLEVIRRCRVTVVTDDGRYTAVLMGGTVSEALAAVGVTPADGQTVEPGMDAALENGMEITLSGSLPTQETTAPTEPPKRPTGGNTGGNGGNTGNTPKPTEPKPTEPQRTVVSVEIYEDCDGSGHGVKVITYSDGTQEEVYF